MKLSTRVWLSDHGWGNIIRTDLSDFDAPYLVHWQSGDIGWHGHELRQPEPASLTFKNGHPYANGHPIHPGNHFLVSFKGRNIDSVIAFDHEWYFSLSSCRLPLALTTSVWR
jgi:hypothetical protein